MAQDLSDAQLLACPEPLEQRFIHRGRRDLIAPQAGKLFKKQDSNKHFHYMKIKYIQTIHRKLII